MSQSGHRDEFAERNIVEYFEAAALVRPDTSELDYLGPLLGFVGD
jgi:hypothetical protein